MTKLRPSSRKWFYGYLRYFLFRRMFLYILSAHLWNLPKSSLLVSIGVGVGLPLQSNFNKFGSILLHLGTHSDPRISQWSNFAVSLVLSKELKCRKKEFAKASLKLGGLGVVLLPIESLFHSKGCKEVHLWYVSTSWRNICEDFATQQFRQIGESSFEVSRLFSFLITQFASHAVLVEKPGGSNCFPF